MANGFLTETLDQTAQISEHDLGKAVHMDDRTVAAAWTIGNIVLEPGNSMS